MYSNVLAEYERNHLSYGSCKGKLHFGTSKLQADLLCTEIMNETKTVQATTECIVHDGESMVSERALGWIPIV